MSVTFNPHWCCEALASLLKLSLHGQGNIWPAKTASMQPFARSQLVASVALLEHVVVLGLYILRISDKRAHLTLQYRLDEHARLVVHEENATIFLEAWSTGLITTNATR